MTDGVVPTRRAASGRGGRRRALQWLAAGGLAAAAAPGAAGEPVVLRLATAVPRTTIWGQQLEQMAEAAQTESKGALRIQVFHGGQLGGDLELVRQLATGRVDMIGVSLPFLAPLAPELQLLGMPMYFRSPEELDCVLESAAAGIGERLMHKGVRVLAWAGTVSIDLVGRRAFRTPADLVGARAGSQGTRIGSLAWSALRADVVPTSNAEIVSAFQTGLIDVAVTAPNFYVSSGLGKVAPVMTRLGMNYAPTVLLINAAAWERLGAPAQEALVRAWHPMPAPLRRQRLWEREELMRAEHVRGGGSVVELDAEQREAFRRVFATIWPRMAQEAGPGAPEFLAVLDEARRACTRRP